MKTNIIYLEETDSTNTYLRSISNETKDDMTVVWTTYQKAGRGQGGHIWESERGKNLLFSILLHPENVTIKRQFILSMAIALAVKSALGKYVDGLSVKWPNDIYWLDKKICGILIENNISSKGFKDCVLGPGINVNQRIFRGDAPNPVSLYQIIGHDTDVREVLDAVVKRLDTYVESIYQGQYDKVRSEYMTSLYRRSGPFPFADHTGAFMASIHEVTDDGHLILEDTDGRLRTYAFKEVEYLINK